MSHRAFTRVGERVKLANARIAARRPAPISSLGLRSIALGRSVWVNGVAAAVLLGTLALPLAALARTFRAAVIVGHNGSDSAALEPLQFADDDAIRYAELFGVLADHVELLVDPDESTRMMFPSVKAQAPTRSRLQAALGRALASVYAARTRGEEALLYFVYSGHGQTERDGTGFVHLADGHFTTRDLYGEVLEPLKGAYGVVIIDACNAALLVHARGGRPERRRATGGPLRLEDYPHVGVVLSSSGPGEVHEWGRFLSGVFSHEVRSALVGPGDIDGDGKVTFAELAAWVASANRTIANPEIRLRPYIRPPLARPDLPVLDLTEARFPARLVLDASTVGHGYVLDEALVRYADFHPAPGQSVTIGLTRSGQEWTVVQGAREWMIPSRAAGEVRLAALDSVQRTTLGSRGAVGEYFGKHLFERPASLEFARDYLENTYLQDLVVERSFVRPWYDNPLGWSFVGGGVALAGAGLGFHLAAYDAREDSLSAQSASERAQANDRVQTWRTTAGALYGVGAASLLTGALLLAFQETYEMERFEPAFSVQVSPGGILIQGSY